MLEYGEVVLAKRACCGCGTSVLRGCCALVAVGEGVTLEIVQIGST